MYNLQDPDTGVLYTRQPISGAEVNQLLNALPSYEDTSIILPVPPRIQVTNGTEDMTSMDDMEGQAVHTSSRGQTSMTMSKEATCAGDPGPADEDDAHRDYYPAEHNHISYGQITNNTPHAQTMEGNNMY